MSHAYHDFLLHIKELFLKIIHAHILNCLVRVQASHQKLVKTVLRISFRQNGAETPFDSKLFSLWN